MFSLPPQPVRKEPRIHLIVFTISLLAFILLPMAVFGMRESKDSSDSIILGLSGPSFSKSFTPDTIGPGSVSTLQFYVGNEEFSSPVTQLAFTDVLPAGVTIATPANATNSCDGTLTAPDGGSIIILSDGDVAGNSACIITVDVTSSTPGTHLNVSGDLTSSAGNSGTARDDLTVATDRPGFSKSFAPGSVNLGGRSTLTFTIDNTANPNGPISMSFTDNLPGGMEIAAPANAATTCGTAPTQPTLTAVSGTAMISFSYFSNNPLFPAVAAGAVCTVSVDVIATGAGLLVNSSGGLISSNQSGGKANAALDVAVNTLYLTKSFTGDPIAAGRTTSLQFTIRNQNRLSDATAISFTDNLNATLPGLVATGLPMNNICGSGSQLTGTSTISLTGGQLAGSSSCTFTVTLQLPVTPEYGNFPNTTSNVTANVNGNPMVGTSGSDTLFVAPIPDFSKQFIDDPVAAGDDVVLRFNIANTSPTSAATDISFIDELTTFLPFPVFASLPSNPCGAGSSISLIGLGTESQGLFLAGGNLVAGGSCSFDVTLTIPVGMPSGSFLNETENITAVVNGQPVQGDTASDMLDIVSAPSLRKSFVDDPVLPGDTVMLEFIIEHDAEVPGDAADITFTDNLTNTLPGLVATGLPQTGICGTGSQISGTSLLTLAGGALSPGESCTFTVTLQMPAGDILPGDYTNTTSNILATVLGLAVEDLPAQDNLVVGAVSFGKSFTDDPVIPGDTVDLEFTIINESSTLTVANLFFTDSLSSALSGLAAMAPLPANPCGAGSSLTGTTTLIFAGGTLGPGESCVFTVTLNVPAGAVDNNYTNVTSNLSGSMDGSPFVVDPATDVLVVSSDLMTISKEFLESPLFPGDTVTLRFMLENIHPAKMVTNIAFVDDLTAVLPNLEAITLPPNPCGAGSQITGTDVLSFSGGQLAAGASCTFDVTLQIPNGVRIGDRFTNVTSVVTGMSDGLPVTGGFARDDLVIGGVSFGKSFVDDPVAPGDTVDLEFTIINDSSTLTVTNLFFTDNLNSVLAGLTVSGSLPTEPCGPGSSLMGTTSLTFSGGTLDPGKPCVFTVTLAVPASAASNNYTNVTSELIGSMDGDPFVIDPATDILSVSSESLTFSKEFVESPIYPGDTVTLRFVLENIHATATVTDIEFEDDLTAVLPDLEAITLPTNPCGASSQITGTDVLAFSGGQLAAGASCTFDVTLQIPNSVQAGAAYLNVTSEVTGMNGALWVTGGMAQDTLTIGARSLFLPIMLKNAVFAPDLIVTSVNISGGNIQIEITNQGTRPVTDDFWVDLYVNPTTPPTMVNQTWELVGNYGAVWGVEGAAIPLDVGETLILTLNDAYYRPTLSNLPASIGPSDVVYVQVDSAAQGSTYGNVLETHEITNSPYNNIWSSTAVPRPE